MISQGFKTFVGLTLTSFTLSCGNTAETSGAPNIGTTTPGTTQTAGQTGTTDPAAATKPAAKPAGPTPEQLAKSKDFFLTKVLPLTKGLPCSDCHNAPRLLKDPAVDGGTGVQEHTKMFALLKDGKGANDNKLINKMLGKIDHKGGKQCADEAAQPCATIKEWYKLVFGDGVLSLGKIENINKEGVIGGWAGNIDAPTTAYEIKLYLDGEKGVGTALPVVMANLDAFDNALTGPHAFSLKVPDALIDGKPHKIWAYTAHAGQDVMLAGSPFAYTAYKPKGAANAPGFAQTNFGGCNGQCHNFVYENRWAIMLSPGVDGTWSATSNSLYDKISGKVAHGGPGLPGGTSPAGLSAWFTQEFGP